MLLIGLQAKRVARSFERCGKNYQRSSTAEWNDCPAGQGEKEVCTGDYVWSSQYTGQLHR